MNYSSRDIKIFSHHGMTIIPLGKDERLMGFFTKQQIELIGSGNKLELLRHIGLFATLQTASELARDTSVVDQVVIHCSPLLNNLTINIPLKYHGTFEVADGLSVGVYEELQNL